MTAGLSLLTLGFSVPPTTAAAPTGSGAAASVSMAAFDYAAEARELDLLERAARKTRQAATGVSRLGTVEVQAAAPVKVEPKKKPAAKKPVKKKATTTKAAGKTAGRSSGTRPATGKATGATSKKPPVAAPKASGNVAAMIAYLRAQIGKPYVYGAAGPNAFDCSGLTQQAALRVGIKLPHQSEAQARYGRQVPRSETRAGDLLHWPGHVAIAVSSTRMISASRAGVPVRESAIYGSPTVHRLIG